MNFGIFGVTSISYLLFNMLKNKKVKPEENNEEDPFSKDKPVSKIYDVINGLFEHISQFSMLLYKIYGLYFLWICLHYLASHLYIRFCVPSTVYGFIMSPFMVATPHCQALRWVVYNAGGVMNEMWTVLGTWLCSFVLIKN